MWKLVVVHYLDRFCVRKQFLFRWDKVPGTDSDRLIEYLKEKYNVDWVKIAKIYPIDNGRSIKIFTSQNNLSLELNSEKTKVELKINDFKIDEFLAHHKNKETRIYKNLSINNLIKYCIYLSVVGIPIIFVLIVPLIIEFGSQHYFEIPAEYFITNAANAQYILSALAQSQAAIIAIVFTAVMIISQMTIGLDSKITRNPLKYKSVIILIVW